MNWSTKLVVLVAVTLVIVSLTAPCLGLAQTRNEGSSEKALFDFANRERAVRGLEPLQWDEALARAARQHALHMADKKSLSHQFPGESDLSGRVRQTGARFVALAENVAVGPSAAIVHAQWMNSPPHRENLLDPQMNSLGIAVAERSGQLFAVQDFSRAIADLPLAEQEKQLGAQLKAKGLRLLKDDGEARKVCETEHGDNPSRRSAFLLRYSTADLENLPDVLLHELKGGRYHAATLAACVPGRQNDFSTYQLAVLLYE